MSTTPRPGLCESCRWQQRVVSARATFVLCRRGLDDPTYPKYPRLPVVVCPGHEPREATPGDADHRRSGVS
jgi:hypothetical protein